MEYLAPVASAVLPALAESAVSSLAHNVTPSNSGPPPASRIPRPISVRNSRLGAPTADDMDVHDVVVNPAIPIRPSFYDTPAQLGSCMILPFQFILHDYTGEQFLSSTDISAHGGLAKLTAPYRFAKLESLEVVVYPRQSASEYAGTVEVMFTPSDVSITSSGMMGHVGCTSISVGGPIGFVSNSSVLCPLDRFSPVVKSPFLPTDRVRVWVNHWLNAKATKASNAAHILTTVLRGTILLSYPSFGG